MTDRESFLLAIRAADPADFLPRLAYADWLDEHPELPAAQATAEFIRLSCRKARKGARVAPERDAWLAANWKRLIPSVVALSVPITEPSDRWPGVPEGGMDGVLSGLCLQTWVTLPGECWYHAAGKLIPYTKLYSCGLQVVFRAGLAIAWKMGSDWGQRQVEPALRIDRPELFLAPAGGNVATPDRGSA